MPRPFNPIISCLPPHFCSQTRSGLQHHTEVISTGLFPPWAQVFELGPPWMVLLVMVCFVTEEDMGDRLWKFTAFPYI